MNTAMNVDTEVARLRVDLDALTGAVEALVQMVRNWSPGATGQDGAPSRWAWRYADSGTAAELWARLREFVDWLNSRYALDSERQVPPCWYRHPVAVEELTALMCSWQSVYCGSDTPGDGLLAWHAACLWPCVDRLPDRASWQRCRGGGHAERAAVIHSTDVEFDVFVKSDQRIRDRD